MMLFPENIMTTSFEGTASFEIYSEYDSVSLIDVMDGTVYSISDDILKRNSQGIYSFSHIPVKDTPLILSFGKFMCYSETGIYDGTCYKDRFIHI